MSQHMDGLKVATKNKNAKMVFYPKNKPEQLSVTD